MIFAFASLGSESAKSTMSSAKMFDFCLVHEQEQLGMSYVNVWNICHVYIYICIYMYICNDIHIYIYVYTYMQTCLHIQFHMYICNIYRYWHIYSYLYYPLHTIWAIVDDALTTPLLHFSCQVVESICGTRQRIKFFLWSRQGFGWFLSFTNLGRKRVVRVVRFEV